MQVAMEEHLVHDRTSELEYTFLAHKDRVLRAAYRVTGNLSDAEDVLQLVFLRLARREDTADITNPGSYLHRAAVNAALDLLRARREPQDITYEDAEILYPLSTGSSGAFNETSLDLRRWLRAAIAKLGARAAEMFVLRYIEGFDNGEIARMLSTSQATVAVTLHRTRARLQKDYREYRKGRQS